MTCWFLSGYRLAEDAWAEYGRRTFILDDDSSRSQIATLSKVLRSAGWEIDRKQLRAFRHHDSNEMIEIEPGGSGTSGHLLHVTKEAD